VALGIVDDERDGHLRIEGLDPPAGKIGAGVEADPVDSRRRGVEGADPPIVIGAVFRSSVPVVAVLALDSHRDSHGGRSGGGIQDMR
jgi:hypothetical protein